MKCAEWKRLVFAHLETDHRVDVEALTAEFNIDNIEHDENVRVSPFEARHLTSVGGGVLPPPTGAVRTARTMSHVFLMRHADRDGAPGFDDPINEVGRARAQGVDWNCDLAIVSPLRRTTQTLEASRVKYRFKIQSDLCRECLDGGPHNYMAGESLRVETNEEFEARLLAFRDFLLAQTKAFASILVITHGVFMCRFLQTDRGVGYCEYRRWQP